jgi:hypothetical protein
MANPDPSPETRFVPGQSGNPGGKTSEHRKAEIRAAELAAKVQLDLVEALHNTIVSAGDDKVKLEAIRADVLKLLKDAQDRAFGTPKASIDLESPEGTLSAPQRVEIVSVAGNGSGAN